MDSRTYATIIVLVLIVGGLLIWQYWGRSSELNITPNYSSTINGGSSTEPNNQSNSSLILAGGEVALSYPPVFGLANTPSQVLTSSYIPPCDPNFDYCFFFNGKQFEGTNFESAGLRIKMRTDIPAERLCLNTPPEGYTNALPQASSTTDQYSTSEFLVSDAGAGHVAQGYLFRLFVRQSSSCYEFETRIGNTQFANYPSGTINEFTTTDRNTIQSMLRSILNSVRLTGTNTGVSFPQ